MIERGPIKAIATNYRGIEYRSRLEAKWAAFMGLLGWQHTYEPFDASGYLPDFLIHGDRPFLVEVKPAVTMDAFRAPIGKITAGLLDHWKRDILIVGVDRCRELTATPPAKRRRRLDCWASTTATGGGASTPALWFRCVRCGEIGICSDTNSYRGRPCGHYDGDDHLGPIGTGVLQRYWANATNLTKWGR